MRIRTSETVIAEQRAALGMLEDPQPRFNFVIGWPTDYDSLFDEQYETTRDIYDIARHAAKSGRVLLTGQGGGAKSAILTRVAKQAMQQGALAVLIRLKVWVAVDYESWKALDNSGARLRFLLQHFSVAPVDPADLDAISTSVSRLLLVDGLNEVDSRTGQEIINALDEYARYAVNTSVVVADRLVRRDFLRPDRWRLCVVRPLSSEEIRRVLTRERGNSRAYDDAAADTKTLLTLPFFLDQYLKEGVIETTTSQQMHAYFTSHALNEAQLNRAAEAAYSVYRDSTRTFRLAEFESIAGQEIVAMLRQAAALVVRDTEAYFDHHLKHDYLAALYLAGTPNLWGRESFNRVSFYASSFDTIVMLMEQIADQAGADDLLRSLYDWNIYAAGYALAEGRETRVSQQMYLVILAMFAERQWDIVVATSTRARDTLRLFGTELARRFLAAQSPQDLAAILNDFNQADGDWFSEWRLLFTRMPGARAAERDLAYLADRDSVIGWTSANVLRRLRLSSQQQSQLRDMLYSVGAHDTVRWRVVHVLGSFPAEVNARALIELFDSATFEVRYGATRSLVEMAARASERLASLIFREVRKTRLLLTAPRGILDEFRRAVFIQPEQAPEFWIRLVVPMIIEIAQHAETTEARDLWDRTAQEMVLKYGVDRNTRNYA
jgi:hypothetical protein